GYLPYDSSVNGKVYTLRDPEVIEQVYLRKGVNALSVIVLDPAGKPIKDAIVRLYNSKSEFLKESQTNIAGETTFENLDNKEPYYLTAWLERFMPAYKVVDLKVSNRETLVIERATAGNSGSVSVYTTDIQGKPLNDVSLNFFVEKEDKIIYPLGLPTQKTDLAGKYQFQAPLNSNVIIEASKGKLQGRANVKVLEAFQNEVVIQLREPFSLVKIKVLDEKGQEQKKGIVSVVSGNDVLFEGEYEEGGITIEPKGNDYVSVKFVPEEGETFEEEVFVKGLEEVSVKKGGQTSVGLVPTIEFLGLTNVDGSPAYGMIKGVDYFLKFRAVFQKDNKNNGIHVRLGEDDTGFIDSEDAGILGFSAVGASSFLGRSYFPKPEPGFEALDYENSGVEGSYSKWIELYFQNGGEKIIKVRVKAKETATKNEIAVKYRAWSTIADKTYRNPEDKELGLEKYSQNKTSLYAETKEEKIRILESTTTCNAEICASYKFIAQDGSEFMPENFTASIGSLYALEISVSQSNENLTIKADTQKQKPKIFFQGIGLNNDTDFIDMERQDTSIQLDNIPLQNSLKARVFFKAIEEGTTSIVLQLSTSKNTITKQFYFETYKEKTMVFRTNPETVSYGKDFSIILQDTENNPIEDAQIILSNKQGENITTIIGNKTFGKGMNGNYIIKNTFSQGEISYEVRAKNFKPKKGTITITKEGIIKFSEEKPYIIIQKGQKIGEKKISIINSTGFEIKDLTFEIVPIRNTEGLNISIQGPNSIGNYQTQDLLIVAEYLGVKESAHAEAKIIARGKISSNEVSVSAQTIAIIDYAPKIPVECLEFSKERIAMYIASGFEDRSYYDTRIAQTQQGKLQPNQFYENYLGPNTQGYPSSYYRYNMFTTSSSEKFTAKLAQKPQCQTQLILKPEITRENRLSEGIEITSTEIKLAPQQTTTGTRTDQQEVTITATNTIIRNFPTKEKFGFTITYKTDGFEKSIPIDIYIWNPRYALQMTTNIELFLAPNERGQYSAQIPLFVRNVGEADIENIEFRLAGATTQGNVELRVLPEYPIQILRKGEAIMPPKILVAQVMRNERTTLLEQKLLDVSGVINGQTFSFGPIIVNAHVSGAQCLIATPQSLDFYHSKAYEGSISRQIILKNTCAEEVRIIDITQPLAIGNNKVNLSPANFVILPGTEAQANIILEKRSPYNLSPQATFIRGFLPRSGKPIESTPIALDIKLGDIAEKSDAASEPIEVEICEEPEKKKIIRFPLIATSQNPKCDVTYCDATQMAQYLTEIIEQKISDAEKQISTYNSDISKTRACSSADIARGFCTFSGLGVKPEVITVFLSHDNMTPQLLTRTLEQSKGTAKSFQAKYMPEAEEGYYIGTGARQVLLNGSLRGCGKYTIRIDGEVAVQGSRIIPELMNIKLLFDKEEDKEERIITEQCTAKAQNIMNFLPRDEGLTKNSNYGAWTSITMPRDSSLEELSKEVAKNLFGSDQRYSQSETGFNTLKLDLTQEDGFIVKLKPEPINPNNPAIITALIKESLGKDDKLQQEITKEATQLIKEFRENQVSCISQDESYALLKTTKELGQIEATPKDTIKVQFGQATCTDLTIKSTTKEKVNLTARKGMAFDGIKGNPFFVPKDKEPNENNKITELSISKFDEKEHKFIETTKICVIGNSNLHQAQGKTILAGITRETTKSKKPKEVEIKLEVCGIHPLDFIEKAKDLEPKREPYYATFVWKGNENDKISINNLEKMSNLENNLKQAQEISEDKRKIKDTDSPEERKAKIWGNGAYLAACSTTSFTTSFLRPMIGLPGAL
ncbi:MAG: carboxypeptidase-like regulatory domain-containing protein, partial [Candidatus Diapherotrites archaeon]